MNTRYRFYGKRGFNETEKRFEKAGKSYVIMEKALSPEDLVSMRH